MIDKIKTFVRYSVYPSLFIGFMVPLIMWLLSGTNYDSATVLTYLAVFITALVIVIPSAPRSEAYTQGVYFAIFGVLMVFFNIFAFPTYTKVKSPVSVEVYQTPDHFKMDVVTPENEEITYIVGDEKTAIRLAKIKDLNEFKLTIEYFYYGSIKGKKYKTTTRRLIKVDEPESEPSDNRKVLGKLG